MTCLEAFRRRRAPFGAVARLPAEERERGKGLHPQSLSSIISFLTVLGKEKCRNPLKTLGCGIFCR